MSGPLVMSILVNITKSIKNILIKCLRCKLGLAYHFIHLTTLQNPSKYLGLSAQYLNLGRGRITVHDSVPLTLDLNMDLLAIMVRLKLEQKVRVT